MSGPTDMACNGAAELTRCASAFPVRSSTIARRRRPALRQGALRRHHARGLPRVRARRDRRRLRAGPRRLRHRQDRSRRGGARLSQVLEELGQTDELDRRRADGGAAMKYLDEYRDGERRRGAGRRDRRRPPRGPWVLMEVCGGQTHSIVRYGIDRMLPPDGRAGARPGLPGVRHVARDDRPRARHRRRARTSSSRSFGDMLRVPGSRGDLLHAAQPRRRRARRLLAARRGRASRARTPTREVVFFGIGFETTAPANAMARAAGASAQGVAQLLDAGLARAGAAGDRGDPAGARQPRAGLPRPGPRLRGDGLPRVRGARARATACRS